jgi:hypothetical protein
MSYGDQMVFGYTANGAALPEVESMARYTAEAFAELEKATLKRTATRRAKAPARRRRKPAGRA